MSIKDNFNNPSVWLEAMFKFCFCCIFMLCLTQGFYHWTDWYQSPPMVQFWMAIGVGTTNGLLAFVNPHG
jgi:hypothetical protein